MKKKQLIFAFFFLIVSCTAQKRELDLTNKGVIRAKFAIADLDTHQLIRPNRIYLARLESTEDYRSDSLIQTESMDESGRIFVNITPGTYAIIATERILNNKIVVTFFNEDLVRRTTVTIDKGQEKLIELKILDYTDSLFDKTPETAKFYRNRINRKQNDFTYFTIGKFMDSPDARKKREEDKIKSEEVKSSIEKY